MQDSYKDLIQWTENSYMYITVTFIRKGQVYNNYQWTLKFTLTIVIWK